MSCRNFYLWWGDHNIGRGYGYITKNKIEKLVHGLGSRDPSEEL